MGFKDLKEWVNSPNHVYIGRPNRNVDPNQCKWGNPFTVEDYGRDGCIELAREWIVTGINPITGEERIGGPLLNDIEELRGKNLGCWCKPLACHGDVLVELLNETNSAKNKFK